ncbi:hypothetical protein PENPOL_c017G01112 [Penicillium polonicum]|uniref:Zn(2)-C6 fungal-type domain-containing protein n=1 Tax=Penicillium polonicum TaxID=60169 RepID=A0A1V6N9X1_PENPO|nr:hypothetical protein PENPOL_c017G01112 [Penicillium polonicum]
MRRGTHSCLACRRRKVRCSFYSPHSNSCDNCARRKTACIPQGDIQHAPVSISPTRLEATTVSDQDLGLFFKALHQLRRRVEDSLRASASSHADIQRDLSEPLFVDAPSRSAIRPVDETQNPETHLSPQIHVESLQPAKNFLALYEMCSALPSDSDIAGILTTRSQWWVTWRKSFGLAWGEVEDSTLTQFATRALCMENPSLLGSLLLCFAMSTGDYSRYLGPVEHWILADNFSTAHEYDFQCLMGLGLCLFSALQPRRAWLVYRKANALLQLAGIHRSHQRSESLDMIFWQLFGADRWVSLLIGLPYSVADHVCYLSIPPANQSTPVIFHHRHMVLLTGQVIDCLQSPAGYSFSTVVSVDEEIDKVTTQLPLHYLSMPHIAACLDADEKSARLYRITEIFQLKTFLYLPLFLQQCDRHKELIQNQNSRHGRNACLSSAQSLLEGYLALYDMQPNTAVVDNSIKLTSFTALAAAVVLFLNLLASAHPTTEPIADPTSPLTLETDTMLINRTVAAFKACSEGEPQSLCGQCYTALKELISCSQILGKGESRKITVPCFGLVEITREKHVPLHSLGTFEDGGVVQTDSMVNSTAAGFVFDELHDEAFSSLTVTDDIFFAYHGPWESHPQESRWPSQSVEVGLDSPNVLLGQYLTSEFGL